MQKLGGLNKQEPAAFDLAAFKDALANLDLRPASARDDFNHDWREFTKSDLPRFDFGTDPKLQTIIDRHLNIRGLDQVITFSEDQARALLAAPVTELDCLFSAGELEQIQKKMEPISRMAIGLPKGEVSYSGSWYYQGIDPVCAVMAIANGAQAVGGSVDPIVFTKLLNLALPKDNESDGGTSYTKLAVVLSEHPASDVKMAELPYDNGLRAVHRPLTVDEETMQLSFGKTFGDERPAQERLQDLRDFNSKQASEAVHNNAGVIKEHLDRGEVLLVSLTRSLSALEGFKPSKKTPLHAVCISGYRISDSGYMDVQLLDSQSGKYWASLEHVSATLFPFGTEILRRA